MLFVDCISSQFQTISLEAAKAHDVKWFNVAWILAVRILEGFFKGFRGAQRNTLLWR